ncbi:hypothetical protein E4U61_001207, partial [Claviceps capensis]
TALPRRGEDGAHYADAQVGLVAMLMATNFGIAHRPYGQQQQQQIATTQEQTGLRGERYME